MHALLDQRHLKVCLGDIKINVCVISVQIVTDVMPTDHTT